VGRDRKPVRGRLARLAGLLVVAAGLALAIDVGLLWESVSERMEGRAHDAPARLTGFVPRLVPAGVATEAGWRNTWISLGYSEVRGGEVEHPGEFSFRGARWTVWPFSGAALEVEVRKRRVESLRRVDDDSRVPSWDFPLPAISLLTDESRERRSVVPLSAMPTQLVRAVVAIEDERFYRHVGIDPRGVARAAVRNLTKGGLSEGGSTITQQLAKNMFLTAERSLARKFQEALIAMILERRYGKDRILEAYLNEIYLGQRGGYAIMGVGEGAHAWFGKDVSALDLHEAALLAGAIHSPNRTVPWKHPDEAKRRRDVVLQKMRELQAAPDAEIEAALAAPLDFMPEESSRFRRSAPWFVDAVVGGLGDRYSAEALHRDGLELVTTLDPRLQSAAEAAVREGLSELLRGHPSLAGVGPQAALLAMDPRTGAVRAMVGGADYGQSQFNRALQARRQPGSAFKPVVLAAAIGERWPRLGPRTLVLDAPITVPGAGPGGRDWTPKNHDDKALGLITLRRAVLESRNLPFVRIGLNVGPQKLMSTARAMGIESSLRPVPSLAIGGQEVSVQELAVAYATLAAGGRRPVPRLLEGVRDSEGRWLERALPDAQDAIDPRVTAVVTRLLEAVLDEGTARGVRAAGFTLPAAGKTGTTNEARDAWMAGYTDDLVVVVWVGADQDRPLGLGSTAAAVPIWSRFMRAVEPWLNGQALGGRARTGSEGELDDEHPLDGETVPEGWEAEADGPGSHGAPRAAAGEGAAAAPAAALEDEDAARRAEEEAAERSIDRREERRGKAEKPRRRGEGRSR
jgi:penicillin-binding protein 1B